MFDVSPDGQRFLLVKRERTMGGEDVTRMVVILNWFEELTRLVPTE